MELNPLSQVSIPQAGSPLAPYTPVPSTSYKSLMTPLPEPTASAAPVAPTPTTPTAPAPTVTAPKTNAQGFVLNPDGSTNYQATLDAVKGSLSKIQEEAKKLSSQNSTSIATTSGSNPGSTVVSSSGPAVAQEQQITQDLNSLTTSDADIKTAHEAYLANLQAESDALEARKVAEVEKINKDFDSKKTQLEQSQKGEKGSFTTTLARIGGFLGDSASAQGALVNLNQTHLYQQQDLETKRQGAIQDAKNAINDKQFAIARLKTAEAKDYLKEIADNKQKFFENKIKILAEQRQQDESFRSKVKDDLEMLAKVSLSDEKLVLDQAKADEIDKFYGVPGFTKQYLEVANAAAKAKNQSEVMKTRKDMLDFLQTIPQGQKISFPDGTEYTGMGKAGDVSTFLQVDSSGTGHLITYNKLTGQKTINNMGIVGKSSGGGSPTSVGNTPPAVVDNVKARLQIELENNKDKNGQYDPDIYIRERNAIKDVAPQLVAYFDNLFLNKNNQFFSDAAIKRLRSKGIFYNDISLASDTPTDETGDTITEGE